MYKKIVFGMIALALVTVLFAACSIIDASTVSSGPQVHMTANNFAKDTVTIKKGDKLVLVDDASAPHIIVNGSWENGQQKATKEPNAPTVNVKYNGNDSGPIGPFTAAGTFHVYCTIHSGMNLAITVQ